jgi:hypothetical protein
MRRRRPSCPLEYKSNGIGSDNSCADWAFSSLEFATQLRYTNSIWFLVKMVDYEKSTPWEWLNGAGKNVVLSTYKGNQEE